MKVDYQLHGIHFEWESEKAAKNLSKHGIHSENACEAFFDPFLCMVEPESVDGQIREAIIGMTMNWKLVYVVFSMREGDIFRLISARLVTKNERRIYE
jgi:hypothetical protein